MPHGSEYGSGVVIVQERQYRPSSTYTVGSSGSRSSGASSGHYSLAMDSRSSSSRSSSSASNRAPDRTGTYRNGVSDGYALTAKLNTKGKRDVVVVHHNSKSPDPDAPRSSESHRA